LKDLLSLKQQQASIVEARETVKQAQETLRQGRAIMLFTVVTIIFVSIQNLLYMWFLEMLNVYNSFPSHSSPAFSA
jgi:hypothetical protein